MKGDIDHFGAMSFLQGVLTVLRDSGHPGLLVVLDEVETIQRVRGDVRDKSLNALRQLIDEVDSGRFPGLYLMITGTPAFFDGPQGVQAAGTAGPTAACRFRRPILDSTTRERFRSGCRRSTWTGSVWWAARIRDIFCEHCPSAERVRRVCDDSLIAEPCQRRCGQAGRKGGTGAPDLSEEARG